MALTKPRLQQLDTTISAFSDPITVINSGADIAEADIGFLINRANGLVSNVALYWSENGNSFSIAYTNDAGNDATISTTQYTDLRIGNLFTSGLFWSNGTPLSTGVRNTAIYLGQATVSDSQTEIDSLPAEGNVSVRWTVSSRDNITNSVKQTVIDAVNDGTNISLIEYATVQSNSQIEVATFDSDIDNGNIKLYATGSSSNVTVTFKRDILGDNLTFGYLTSGPKGDTGIGIQGNTGPKGDTGETGASGSSAYEIAVANGFSGTQSMWLSSLVGPQGEQGPPGGNVTIANTSSIVANVATGENIGLSLTNTGVSAGTYGSATAIPTVVVDSQGRITSITSNSVIANINLSGTSGTGVISNNGTLAILGEYGITATVLGSNITLSTPQDLRTTANPTFNNVSVNSIQGPIGNSTPSTGAFTTLSASGITTLSNTTNSTDTINGALVVAGGTAVAKDLRVGGSLYLSGNLQVLGTQTVFSSNTVEVSDPILYIGTGNTGDVLDIGIVGHFNNGTYQHTGFVRDASDGIWKLFANVQTEPSESSTLDFTDAIYSGIKVGPLSASSASIAGSLSASSASIAGTLTATSIQETPIGNSTPSTGSFTTLTASSTLSVTGATTLTTLTANSIQSLAIGNVTPGSGAFTTLTSSGSTSLGATTATSINSTPIGNSTPSTGAFTALTSSGSTSLGATTATSINSTPIGNSTPSTGAFTTLTASGATTLTSTTSSTNTSTGALVVSGGTGIAGNLNVGGTSNYFAGNILVNNTNGQYKVTVVQDGAGNANSGIGGAGIVLARTNGYTENIGIKHTGSTTGISGQTYAGQIIGNGVNVLEIYTTGGAPLSLGTNSTERVRLDASGHLVPTSNGTYDLGSSSARWRNIYTSDLNLSNGIGDYTIVEGEEDLFLYNNKNGKTYKFMLAEVSKDQVPRKLRD